MSGDFILALFFALAAALYGAVGHGGASAYLAVMALAGFAPDQMRVSALTMNIGVSAIGAVLFFRHFRWRLFWPFAISAVPAAWLGGSLTPPPSVFSALVSIALLAAAARLFLPARTSDIRPIRVIPSLLAGAIIGLMSGLAGVGGGIFLTPLLILLLWASPREASAVSALFILSNSVAGLGGLAFAGGLRNVPESLPVWLVATACGGFLGAWWGSHRARPVWLRHALGVVLVIASLKFAGQGLGL